MFLPSHASENKKAEIEFLFFLSTWNVGGKLPTFLVAKIDIFDLGASFGDHLALISVVRY